MPFQDYVVTNQKFVRLNMVGVVRKNVAYHILLRYVWSTAAVNAAVKAALRLVYESLKEEQELAITSGNEQSQETCHTLCRDTKTLLLLSAAVLHTYRRRI